MAGDALPFDRWPMAEIVPHAAPMVLLDEVLAADTASLVASATISADSPVMSDGERGWFFFYAVAAFLYRVAISFAISLFIATNICENIMWKALSPVTIKNDQGIP